MDDTEDDMRFPYNVNQGYGSLNCPNIGVRNVSYPHQLVGYRNVEDDEDEGEEEDDDDDDDDEDNGVINVKQNGKAEDGDGGDDEEEEEEEEDDDDDESNDYSRRIENIDQHRHQKKRKMTSLLSSYEFAPRVVTPSAVATTSAPKESYGGRNSLSDWTEHETFVLLDAWGDRFVQRGRKNLRCEEWQVVAEKVSLQSKLERSDTQCRNRLDTLKKKYKKEKLKLQGVGVSTSKWVYFKKMDVLLSSTPRQTGVPRGLDSSGEYTNPSVYHNHATALDVMRDIPGNSVSVEAEGNDFDVLPPKKTNRRDGASFRLLADSIQKFSDIYEKTENIKRQQMLELEKMRMDFHRDLEMQKRQMLERARDEIVKIRQGEEENEASENVSG